MSEPFFPIQGGIHAEAIYCEARQGRTKRTFSIDKHGVDCGQETNHAQVLLLADSGKHGSAWKDKAIAEACQVTVQTVENIRKRLVLEGLESAFSRKKQLRPSRQKILDGGEGSESCCNVLWFCTAWSCTLDAATADGTNRRTKHCRIRVARIRVARNGAPLFKKTH